MSDTLFIPIRDSVNVFVHTAASKASDSPSALEVAILGGFVAIVTSILTTYFTRKNELDKIKAELNKLTINLYTENFKALYQEKLGCLKKLRSIWYENFSLPKIPSDTNYDLSIHDLYAQIAGQASSLEQKFKQIIIDYAYLFGSEINSQFNLVNNTIQQTVVDYDAKFREINEEPYLETEGKSIYSTFEQLIKQIEDDLLLNNKGISQMANGKSS